MQNCEQSHIRAGDIVHLNSGSPELTVVAIDSDRFKVEWVEGHLTLRQAFPRVCLKHPWQADPQPEAASQQ